MTTALCSIHLSSLDENAFEEWLCLYMQEVYGLPLPPQRNGRSGQAQAGVDLMFRNAQGEWVGVQAKAYARKRLTAALVDAEITAAHEFEPPLTHYVVCTLNDRDAVLQEHARDATINGHPNVVVLALQDLAEEASRRQPLMRDLLRRVSPDYLEAMRGLLQPHAQALATASTDLNLIGDPTLRAIGAWIEVGNPRRALAELASYEGAASWQQRTIVEIRARFALGELDAVIQVARDEASHGTPSPVLLAYGAHAIALKGDQQTAEIWLEQAMAIASSEEKPQVVGSYLRVKAQRDDINVEILERFATAALGDSLLVALALADTAFQLGELEAATHWYERARAREANWPVGARGNELGARIWKLIRAKDAGASIDIPLRECVAQLESMLAEPTLQAIGLRQPLLINLGHARRTLGDFQGTSAAWDEALGLPEAPEHLWIHRCLLSAMEGVPLPSEELIALCAKSHTASLVLATACITLGETERAGVLVDAVLSDAAVSKDDLVRAHIERIRLESSGQDDRITPAHVATMLGLVDPANPSLPLFVWLVDSFRAAGPDQCDVVREALHDLASRLPIDAAQRVSLAEGLLRAHLDETTIAWLPDIEREAWPDRGRITQLGSSLTLLRIYTRTFRFDDARGLVSQLIEQYPLNATAVLQCAHALHSAGDRLGAYEILTDAIRRGIQDGNFIGSWARLAVMLKQRRKAHRLLRQLQIAPRNPTEYAELLQARALLGVCGDEGLSLTSATQVTPNNAVAVFTSGLLHRSPKPSRVAYGRIVHLRIDQEGAVRMDEQVLLQQEPGDGVSGVRTFASKSFPWVAELLGAQVGETRTLTSPPFANCSATIVDVVGSDRWSVMQAAQMVHHLPPATTGVETVRGDIDGLREQLSQQVHAQQLAREKVLRLASTSGAAICMIAAASSGNPRGLLRALPPWKPTGYPGGAEDILAADEALTKAERLVLDPITLLLIIDIGAEPLLGSLPKKPIMTPQAAWQLFDLWYELERHHRGTAGHAATTSNGDFVIIPVTAQQRRSVQAFWRRVRNAISQHVEIVEPPPLTNVDLIRCIPLVGRPVVSGMALAAARDWAYVTEEGMLAALAKHIANAKVGSLHRLFAIGAARAWWRSSQAVIHLATLIRHGWSWVSFPVSMVRTALRLPAPKRQKTVEPLLRQIKKSEPGVAIRTLFGLLRDIDKNVYPDIDPGRLRKLAIGCLPSGLSRGVRTQLAQDFARLYPSRMHRASRRCLERWAIG